MEVHQLRYFLAVAEEGNFSRAAERMRVAQPSLSQQIQKLEGEVGQPLFDRLPRRVALTEAGQTLRAYVENILMSLSEAKRRLVDRNAETGGTVRVGLIPTIAPFLAGNLLRHVQNTHGGITITVVEGVTDDLARCIDSGELDFAVLSDCQTLSGMHLEFCAGEPLVIAVPKGHTLANRSGVTPRQLQTHTVLALQESNCLTAQVKRWCRRHRVQVQGELPLVQLSTLLALVASGQGISLIPAMASKLAQEAGCETVAFGSQQTPIRKINILRNASRYQSKASFAAAEAARSSIRDLVKSASD